MVKIFKKIINRIIKKRALYLINVKYVGTNPKYFVKKLKAMRTLGYSVGENTKIVGPINVKTQLVIGKNCWIGRNFCCDGNGKVIIGDNCDIAPEVLFATGGHHVGNCNRRAGDGLISTIEIKSGTWVGTRTTIINNITIGEGCIIAACSCVTKGFDKNCLIAGVPATKKKEYNE